VNPDLAGQAAIVTGAASGIGAATAAELATQGASVALVDLDRDGLDKTAQELRDAGAHVIPVVADLSTGCGVTEAMRAAVAGLSGTVSVLVNNVGVCEFRPFDALADADWDRTWQVDFMSAVRACRAVLPVMRAAQHGVIIMVASDLAKHPLPVAPDYCTAKAALLALTKVLAQGEAPAIRVNAVAPGPIDTPLWWRPGGLAEPMAAARQLPPRQAVTAELQERGIPLGRLGHPREVAAAITFLASPAASFITSAVLDVGGGSNGHIT
jgi:NAD(P)-dependent dehydrogenase (short-subunit alcohol dehydrogenase family)